MAQNPPPCWLPSFEFYLFFLSLFLVSSGWELEGFVEVSVKVWGEVRLPLWGTSPGQLRMAAGGGLS